MPYCATPARIRQQSLYKWRKWPLRERRNPAKLQKEVAEALGEVADDIMLLFCELNTWQSDRFSRQSQVLIDPEKELL
jgi:hypothetical protein